MSLALVKSRPMDREQSIREAGLIWATNISDLPALKKRIRAEAEAQIEREVKARRQEAARAIHRARQLGASKAALREVTTKDHGGFEGYVALGEELAGGEKELGA